ncbi:hypothetical protein ROR02_12510 [Pararhodospirillum oryzae]|uniref:Uncharacterized protein n=1 Tax=Pararhodospirillum oryzae TaxID=478448 RepID=A0A512H6V5_9PROT|nr:hypothetical protein ROR02_12510 [Pararhodospirillum oryzae]
MLLDRLLGTLRRSGIAADDLIALLARTVVDLLIADGRRGAALDRALLTLIEGMWQRAAERGRCPPAAGGGVSVGTAGCGRPPSRSGGEK